jgi:hypothetical protein
LEPLPDEKSDLLLAIRNEFHQENPPTLPKGWERFTDDIKAQNYWEGIEETKPFWGKNWSTLSLDDFDKCWGVFSWLPKENIAYFLGGYMTLSISSEPYDFNFCELFDIFDPREVRRKKAKPLWALNRIRIAPLNARQRIIIVEYLKFLKASGFDVDTSFMQGFLLGSIQE